MKYILPIVLFSLLLNSCTKENFLPPAPLPPPSPLPFVEYRDPYTGSFRGIMLKSQKTSQYMFGPNDTIPDQIISLSKSPADDSTMIMDPLNDYVKLHGNGKFTTSHSWPWFHLTLKNDSMFFYGYLGGATSGISYSFRGKKQ